MSKVDEFRLPGSSFSQLKKIIQGYGHYPTAVSPDEITNVSGVNSSEVSRNGKFLTSFGVIDGGQKKTLTDAGKRLNHALGYGNNEEERDVWVELARQNEFAQKVLAAVRIRHGMERSALQSHIAYSSGQKKSPIVMTGANALVDILISAGMLSEMDGKLVAAEKIQNDPVDQEPTHLNLGADQLKSIDGVERSGLGPGQVIRHLSPAVGIAVSIQINVDCPVDDLGKLSGELRSLLEELQYIEGAKTKSIDGSEIE